MEDNLEHLLLLQSRDHTSVSAFGEKFILVYVVQRRSFINGASHDDSAFSTYKQLHRGEGKCLLLLRELISPSPPPFVFSCSPRSDVDRSFPSWKISAANSNYPVGSCTIGPSQPGRKASERASVQERATQYVIGPPDAGREKKGEKIGARREIEVGSGETELSFKFSTNCYQSDLLYI